MSSLVDLIRVKTEDIIHEGEILRDYLDNLSEAVTESTSAYTVLDAYSDLVVDNDWTVACNAALATGKPVLTSNRVYPTSGNINCNGNRFFGRGRISCTQFPLLPAVPMSVPEPDTESVRMMYLAECSNLAEYLVIKHLGFNEIDWHPHTNTDALQVLDNAQAAGLRVRLTTSEFEDADIADFVASVDSHPALVGYSVFDEPATRGFTVAQQNTRINLFRAVTSKELSMVDLASALGNGPAFNHYWSQNYDLVFVDAYSLHYSSGTPSQWLKQDLNKFRFDFGTIMAQTKCDRVIPMMSAYVEPAGQNPAYYSQDVDQVVAASSVFGKVGGGNFAAFVWDFPFDAGVQAVRDNAKLIKLCSDTAAQRTRRAVAFKPYIFGGTGSDKSWSLQELLDAVPVLDKDTTDPNVRFAAHPIRLRTGGSDTDRTTTTAGINYSGIGYKGSQGSLLTNIPARKHVRMCLEYFTLGNSMPSSFSLITTDDGGYTISADIYNAGVVPGTVINADVTPGDYGAEFPDRALVLRVTTNGDTGTLYRKFLRGIVICSDW